MATGQYGQSFNFLLTKGVSNVAGDQLLGSGGIAFQLNPNILPDTSDLELELIWRSLGFTGDITLKGNVTTSPNVLGGDEAFSQTVGADAYNNTGSFKIANPSVISWLTLVTNNPTLIGLARVDECALNIIGVGSPPGMFLSF